MTWVPYRGGAFSEARIVAMASRAAACVLAVVAVAVVGLVRVKTQEAALGAPVVTAFIEAPQPETPPNVVRVQRPVAEAVVASFAAAEGEAEWPHLWTYDALGRIVFRTDEQLVRCSNARRRGYEESDCPDSSDRTPMISREGVRYSGNVRGAGAE